MGLLTKPGISTSGLGLGQEPDLGTSAGLGQVGLGAGGEVAEATREILQPKPGLLRRALGIGKSTLLGAADIVSRPNYAIASAIRNVIDEDEDTGFFGGLKSGITGQTKHTFHDVFTEAGWNPETRAGKITKGIGGFALDVLLDPTTYLTFGTGAGAKISTKAGTKVLSKAGTKFVQKALQSGKGINMGEDFVRNAVVNMAENSPELYGRFLDQGGIKFFGNTLVSSGRIKGLIDAIPGTAKAGEITAAARNNLYSLVNRNYSAKFGKLPDEFIKIRDKMLDLSKVKSADAIDEVLKIAEANKLSIEETKLITNAIENGLRLADDRLDNARQLFQQIMGRNLKDEIKAGIQVGELPNYVAHLLKETPVKVSNFANAAVPTKLGAAKTRTIGKILPDIAPNLKPFAKLANQYDNVDDFVKAARNVDSKISVDQFTDLYNKVTQPVIGKGTNIQQATIKEINEAFGKEFFDENVVNAVATRSLASARATTNKEFLKEVAKKMGVVAKKAPSNYIESSVKELAGLKFHPAVVESIENFRTALIDDEAVGNLTKAFDRVQNLWKASVTSIWPAFHGRNAISNVILNYLDIGAQALNPARHALAGELLLKNAKYNQLDRLAKGTGAAAKAAKSQLDELSKQVIINDGVKKWTFGELRKVIRNNRVAFGDDFMGFLDIPETVSEKLSRTMASKAKKAVQAVNPLSQENVAFRLGRGVARNVEEQARLVNFISNLQRSGDVATAAARTKQFLFDYSNLSNFEKKVLRRAIPFYTFTRKNLELQVRQFLKQPGKYATQAKAFTNISKAFSGGGLNAEEQKAIPGWAQNTLGIVTGRKGGKLEMITGFGTPVEAAFDAIKPNVLLGSLTPIAAVPLQVAIGKSFFFQRDLKDLNNAKGFENAPQFIKDYIGYTERVNKDGTKRPISLDPTRMFLIQNIPPLTRTIPVINQLKAENVSGKLKFLRALTGLRPYGFDLSEEQAKREREKVRELQDLLNRSGVAPVFQRSFIPKETQPTPTKPRTGGGLLTK